MIRIMLVVLLLSGCSQYVEKEPESVIDEVTIEKHKEYPDVQRIKGAIYYD